MKVVNCTWELENLGKRVLEIDVDRTDEISRDIFERLCSDYQYIVVKVPVKMIEVNSLLTSMGFVMVETQFSISKSYKSFNFDDRLIKVLYPHVRKEEISSFHELESLLYRISDDMFSTDRVYLDYNFPPGSSSHRYKNWIKTEYKNKTSVISNIMYDDSCVGFCMDRFKDDTYLGLLGGIFKEYQSEGLALCTGGIHFMDSHKRDKPFKKIKTAISSNNMPVLEVYNYLGFKIDNLSYVFIKHNFDKNDDTF